MKKFFKSFALIAVAAVGLAGCENVPSPFNLPTSSQEGGALYSSASLSDWSSCSANNKSNPWDQGSSYTQATGYQKWDGSTTKSNKDCEGYLISPEFTTVTSSGSSYVSFDYCVAYASNDANYLDHIKMYITDQEVEDEAFDASKWTEVSFKASYTSSDWTLTTQEIQIPDAFANKEKVRVAYWFVTASATKSVTFELQSFSVNDGKASGGGDTPTPAGTEVTCAEAAALINELPDGATAAVDGTYTVTGYITSDQFTVSSMPCFYMDDTKGGAETIEAFGATLPTGITAFTKGMKVKVTGTLKKYYNSTKGTNIKEIDNITNVEVIEDGGDTPSGDAKGSGTLEDPYNVAGIIKYTSALASGASSTEKVYFKGIVSSVKEVSTSYNNATFYISEDGTTSNQFYVFRCLGVGGGSITSATDVEVGDEVVMYGTVTNYMGNTPETVQKEAYIYSIKKGEGGGEDPTPTPTGEGISIDGTTLTLSNSAVTAGTESTTIDLNAQGYINKQAITTVTMSDGTTITFGAGSNTTAPAFYTATKGVRVYANNTISFAASKTIAKVVVTCDSYNGTNYVGNETASVSFTGNNALYTNTFTGTSGGGTQLRVQTITVYYAK